LELAPKRSLADNSDLPDLASGGGFDKRREALLLDEPTDSQYDAITVIRLAPLKHVGVHAEHADVHVVGR
jgi:hypothetical protein